MAVGVSQECTLFPLIFHIYSSDIPRTQRDCSLLLSGVLVIPLQEHLRSFKSWYFEWRLEINEEKSKFIISPKGRDFRRSSRSTAEGLSGRHQTNYHGGWSTVLVQTKSIVRDKALGAYIKFEQFFKNRIGYEQTKFWAFESVIRIQLTYALPIRS